MVDSRGARRLARMMALIAGLGAGVIPLVETVAWAFLARTAQLSEGERRTDAASGIILDAAQDWGVAVPDPTLIAAPALLAGWIVSLIFAAPLVVGLWSVRRTFIESAEGRPFSDVSVASFRRFALASLIAVLAVIVERSVTGVVVSVLSPEIQNQLAISLGSEDVSRLFVALLLVAVAHMFVEAKRLAEDVEGLL